MQAPTDQKVGMEMSQRDKINRMFSWSASLTDGSAPNGGGMGDPSPDVVAVNDSKNGIVNPAFNPPSLLTQQSTVWSRKQQAVCVRHAFKHYGSKSNPNHVLSNLNMTVAKGTIYGLLGASGCGKTTLLSCIVGRRRLNTGEIWVLGGKPGTKGSGVPGKRVGYMPQEIALYGEFSIAETMMYFGWIFGMETPEIEDRLQFLLNFLDLPSQARLVKNLSGGQQRRVSFAVALMHDPELLILDEPTAGTDPVLSSIIWTHLIELSNQGKTVIITTHYIEEARQANVVGLMRQGVLLAEDAPERLIAHYNVESLEDVFLCLCNEQEVAPTVEVEPEKKVPFTYPFKEDATNYSMFWPHTKAILYKNLKWITHNWFAFVMLSYALSLACIIESNECLKHYPPQRVGVVNHGENSACVNYDPRGFNCSDMERVDFSCQFLESWRSEKPHIPLSMYKNIEDAMKDGKKRKLVTILEIPYNFTSGILERFHQGMKADSDLIDTASMDIHIDSTDYMAVYRIEQDIRDVFHVVSKDHLQACGYLPRVAKAPPMIIKQDAFFGKNIVYEPYDYSMHIAIACMCSITYLVPLFLLTISLCLEKMSGSYTRVLVGGVRIVEIFAGYVIILVVFNLTNTLSMGFVQFVIYGKPYGNFWLIYTMLQLLGFAGVLFGLFIVVLVNGLAESAGIGIVASLAMYTFTGFYWPIEAAYPPIVGLFSRLIFPMTMVLKAFLSIILKDAGLFDRQVLYGYGICLAHSVLYAGLIYLIIRRRTTL
uniref:ABC transporter G family member 23 n=1 Tax=Cacopsylla melanoneura TaxID=428564 RepID=A0A8D8LFH1_9HEMI